MPEVRRLLQALDEAQELQARRLRWSHFRRQHQGRAQHFHRLRRARQAPAVSVNPQAPLQLLGIPALTDEHWEQLRPLLPPQKPVTGRPATDHRLIVEAMLWVARTGSRLSGTARALWTVVNGGQSLSTLAQRGAVDTHLAGLASV